MGTNKVACPECGVERELVPVPDKPGRVQAFCDCGGKGLRPVYETDAEIKPAAQPTKRAFAEKE